MTLPEPIEIQPGGDHCDRPNLTERRVLKWANAFFKRTGAWPDWHSGPIPGASGETWLMVAGGWHWASAACRVAAHSTSFSSITAGMLTW